MVAAERGRRITRALVVRVAAEAITITPTATEAGPTPGRERRTRANTRTIQIRGPHHLAREGPTPTQHLHHNIKVAHRWLAEVIKGQATIVDISLLIPREAVPGLTRGTVAIIRFRSAVLGGRPTRTLVPLLGLTKPIPMIGAMRLVTGE